jgi:hypothetical protein
VTVDRAPDYRARWPRTTTETYRVRQVGPASYHSYPAPGYYQPYAAPILYDVKPVPYVSPLSHPHLYSVPQGIVLNTRQHVRVEAKALQRAYRDAYVQEYQKRLAEQQREENERILAALRDKP